uniref:Surface antigen 4 n=5 Tax=Sarcocystis TaxID=5812 RepID=D6MUY8_SARFA|nr:surface antigen 4 [Sarcocystis falcatula]
MLRATVLRATLVATAVIYLAGRLQYVVARNPEQATCVLGQATAVTEFETFGGLNIVCPQGSALQQVPPAPGAAGGAQGAGYVFSTDQANPQGVVLEQVVPGATFAVGQNGQPNVLNVAQLPSAPQSIYFLCRQPDNQQQTCFIRVNIPVSPPLGPNACVVHNTEVQFKAGASNATVQFSCGNAAALQPQQATKIFDQTCQQEVDLETVTPGATCQRPAAGGMVAVTFPRLPPQNRKLCFVCTRGQENCKVIIDVAADPAGGAAVGITARTASALGIVVVAAGLLGVY